MTLEVRIPARCWIAPEMPTATYNVGLTVLPVCPTWSACGRHPASTTARDAQVGDVLHQGTPEPGGDAGSEVLPHGARREHDGSVTGGVHTVGDRPRVSLRRIHPEPRVRQGDHLIRTEPAQLVRAPHGTGRKNESVHVGAPAQRIRQASGAGHHLVGDLADGTIPLLEHREDGAHRTFASSRSRRTSSGTAAEPSPTILPACRSGGRVSERISSAPGPGAVGLISSGFFFAAMIPLSAG